MQDRSTAHLSLWKHQLGCVPDRVWTRTGLETLILAENKLREMPDQIGCLKRLRMLDLEYNDLTKVPQALADLDNLTDFLYLHENRLIRLPLALTQIQRNVVLDAAANVKVDFKLDVGVVSEKVLAQHR